jgi:transposase-like protein
VPEDDAMQDCTKEAKRRERDSGVRSSRRCGWGPATCAVPRARIQLVDGTRTQWRNETVRPYERRTMRVDEAILGVYLAAGSTRRIKGALTPLLKGEPLSKDAVSRLVGRVSTCTQIQVLRL